MHITSGNRRCAFIMLNPGPSQNNESKLQDELLFTRGSKKMRELIDQPPAYIDLSIDLNQIEES